ncbi:hypothetical protein ACJX0J_012139, partial [Zea mays]
GQFILNYCIGFLLTTGEGTRWSSRGHNFFLIKGKNLGLILEDWKNFFDENLQYGIYYYKIHKNIYREHKYM